MNGSQSEELNGDRIAMEREARSLLDALFEAFWGHGDSLGDEELEAIELFALAAILRRKRSPLQAAIHFMRCLSVLPAVIDTSALQQFVNDIYLYGEVLSRWFDQPAFVDGTGKPLALPALGPRLSVASLVHSIDPDTDSADVLAYLISIGAVTQVGELFIPLERKAIHHGQQSLSPQLNFRGIVAHMRTCETHVRKGLTPQYCYTAAGQVPKDNLEDSYGEMRAVGDECVLTWDESMSRTRPDTPTRAQVAEVEVVAGAFVNFGKPIPSLLPDNGGLALVGP